MSQEIELLEIIGQGEDTVVWRGIDQMDREIAVKVLNDAARKDARRVDQFFREAQFLAHHPHDNVVTVYGIDRSRGWIMLELMDGSLQDHWRKGPLDPDRVRSAMQQVLQALDVLHRQKKIHGRVRPGNVLLKEGRVKLAEMEGTDVGGVLSAPRGSSRWIAPEIVDSTTFGDVGPALDLYCLGFSALAILYGPEFDAAFLKSGMGALTDPELAWMRWHGSPTPNPPARQIAPNVPPDLASAIDAMIRKNVSERPKSAAEALKLLEKREIVLIPDVKQEGAPKQPEVSDPIRAVKGPEPAPGGPVPPVTGAKSDRKNADRPPTQPERPRPAHAPYSREWWNEKLGKPYVLYPLLAAMLLFAIVLGLALQSPEEEVAVKLKANAPVTRLIVDGKEVKANEHGDYPISFGDHQFVASAKDYDDVAFESKVGKTTKSIPIAFIEKPSEISIEIAVAVEPPDAELRVDGKAIALKQGTAKFDLAGRDRATFAAAKPGYKSVQKTIEKEALKSDDYSVKIVLAPNPIETLPVKDPPSVAKAKLPASLVPVETAGIDAASGLPLRVTIKALDGVAPLEAALVPAGEYTVGVPASGEIRPGEVRSKTIQVAQPFYAAVTEISNEHFAEYVRAANVSAEVEGWKKLAEEDGMPARAVDHGRATAFAEWAGGRLPSEQEWEIVARGTFLASSTSEGGQDKAKSDAGEVTVSVEADAAAAETNGADGSNGFPYPWGKEKPTPSNKLANLSFGDGAGAGGPQNVQSDGSAGEFAHLIGNVAEWCSERYEPGEEEESLQPTLETSEYYVVRGGSYLHTADDVRVTWRAMEKKAGAPDIGWRIVVPVTP